MRPPCVTISYGGWLTPRPQVHVSVCSIRGSQGVYDFDADSVGDARATMYGKGLADIMQCRLIDERKAEQRALMQPKHAPAAQGVL